MSPEVATLSAALKPLLEPLSRGQSLRADALESVFHVLVAHVEQLARIQHALRTRVQRLCDGDRGSRDGDDDDDEPSFELTQPPPELPAVAAPPPAPRQGAPQPNVDGGGVSQPRSRSPATAETGERETGEREGSTRLRRKRRRSRRPACTPIASAQAQSPRQRSGNEPSPLRPQQLNFQATPVAAPSPPPPPPPPSRSSHAHESPHEQRGSDSIPPQHPGSAGLQGFRTPAAVHRALNQELRRQRLRDTPLVQERRVRGNDLRRRAVTCAECERFFRAEAAAHEDPELAYEQLVQSTCRHRRNAQKQSTPDDYWQLTFQETETQAPP
ncbi:short-chain dehydrogenase/reductase SDR [Gracilaria domingensis]|nr:short-chain dehydrogenase/reductase SDR [Gracilaria domingensis]